MKKKRNVSGHSHVAKMMRQREFFIQFLMEFDIFFPFFSQRANGKGKKGLTLTHLSDARDDQKQFLCLALQSSSLCSNCPIKIFLRWAVST